MSALNSKIEIYDLTDTLVHTLTNIATKIHTRSILTSGVGTFEFTIPSKIGVSYPYTGIGQQWKTKIYLSNSNAFSASDLVFAGRIKKITAPLNAGEGYLRIVEGKALGEVLERRFKTNKRWQSIEADDIAAEVGSDLSLTTDLATDTNAVTLTVQTQTYFELLSALSDYWLSAGSKITKDFYVDNSGVLVWKARPLRTVGVESFDFSEGSQDVSNLLNYKVTYDSIPVRNNITVYGAANGYYPSDRDNWTENNSANWTATTGTLDHTFSGNTPRAGTDSILATAPGGSGVIDFYRTHDRVTIRDINTLDFFYFLITYPLTSGKIRLMAPDASNYFEAALNLNTTGSWQHFTSSLGPANEYHATLNPDGDWTAVGNANWWDIKGIWFYLEDSVNGGTVQFDAVWYSPVRCTATVSDATSIAAYGQCDAEFTDEALLTDTECAVRANTLLYQLKDAINRIDIQVKGTNNLLLGDRIAVTIPAEAMSAVNYDVVAVAQDYSMQGWTTTASMVNTGNCRVLPPASLNESVTRQLGKLKAVTSQLYSKIVG